MTTVLMMSYLSQFRAIDENLLVLLRCSMWQSSEFRFKTKKMLSQHHSKNKWRNRGCNVGWTSGIMITQAPLKDKLFKFYASLKSPFTVTLSFGKQNPLGFLVQFCFLTFSKIYSMFLNFYSCLSSLRLVGNYCRTPALRV